MNKTQLLSDTENLLLQGKVTYNETGTSYLYSNDGTLACRRGRQDHIFHASFL